MTPKSSGLRLGRPFTASPGPCSRDHSGEPLEQCFPHHPLVARVARATAVAESCPPAGLRFSLVQSLHLPLHNKNCFLLLFHWGTSARWAGLSLHFKDEIKALERKYLVHRELRHSGFSRILSTLPHTSMQLEERIQQQGRTKEGQFG